MVLKEKETFIEYLQKQLEETKSKLDSEVCTMGKIKVLCVFFPFLVVEMGWGGGGGDKVAKEWMTGKGSPVTKSLAKSDGSRVIPRFV